MTPGELLVVSAAALVMVWANSLCNFPITKYSVNRTMHSLTATSQHNSQECMNEWMDGWMGGWMGGWINE